MLTIQESIESDFRLNREILHIIESYGSSNLIKDNVVLKEVDPAIAGQYIGDLYGLLTNIMNIPPEAVYITIRINGYASSIEYDGRKKIYLLNPEVFSKVYSTIEMYLRNVN